MTPYTPYTHSTEIRKVFELDELANVLEDDWRTLFYLIPRKIADIDQPAGSYPIRYNGTHESELDEYGKAQNTARARLLLEEWGTSGRKAERPTLGHLYALVDKGGMIRACRHIEKLLKVPESAQPNSGPAAPIDVDSELDRVLEEQLGKISYPNSTALQNGDISITQANNLDYQLPSKREDVVNPPNAVPDSIIEGTLPILSRSDNNEQSVVVPMLSDLLRTDGEVPEASTSNNESTPRQTVEGVTISSTSDSASESINSTPTPTESMSRVLPVVLPTIPEAGELPNLSIFGSAAPEESVEAGLPALSALLPNSEDQPNTDHSSRLSTTVSSEGDTSASNSSYSSAPQSSNVEPLDIPSNLIVFSSEHPVAAMEPMINFPFALLQTVTANFDSKRFTNRNPMQPDGRILGTGGFGEVFLALNLTTTYPVSAVKRLFPTNYKYKEKFERELEILSNYNHPNIVKLIGFSKDVTLCLVYEYLPDGTLGAALEKSRQGQLHLPVNRRISYLLGVAAALEYLHGPLVQVVHRDVTLANILLHGDVAKLCDFGLVRRIDSMTSTEVSGTGPYISPEAMRGTVTPALDVYSFGVVLAEVVTGEEVLSVAIPEGTGDLIERVTERGADLESMVDRKITSGELSRWLTIGKDLLKLSNWCLRDRFKRPSASAVRSSIQDML